MPIISVNRDRLFESLGQTYTQAEFEGLCFDYGIELDDVTTEEELLRKELGQDAPANGAVQEEILYKIDIPANRYDMLCLEGIATALNIFRKRIKAVAYQLADMSGKKMLQMRVRPETALVRPFVACAILRGVTFDQARYKGFIDLQDKLHQNLCRQRSLVAIGTHDLAKIQAPFTYQALPPEAISFVPLKQTQTFNAQQLFQHYKAHDERLRKFLPIIESSLVYPVITDAQGTVLSLPPIINGAHPAISLETRDVFIEVTSTDRHKGDIVLSTLCAMYSAHCAVPFQVEPVEVTDALGAVRVTPDLSTRSMEVEVALVNRYLGIQLSASSIADLVSRMALDASPSPCGSHVTVHIPPTRSDVLHPCDVIEDVAIAYGYNNLERRTPAFASSGAEQPLNQLSDMLRAEAAMAGYTEILTWALCSRADNFSHMQLPDNPQGAVAVGNPATLEFELCRTSLLPGLMKTVGANKDAPVPLRLFEASDVVLPTPDSSTGSTNSRRLAAVHVARESGFEIIHGLLNRLMEKLGVEVAGLSNAGKGASTTAGTYSWRESDSPSFFPGRHATVYLNDERCGEFGVIHPSVLKAFDIIYPVAAMELDLELFCHDQMLQKLPTHFILPTGADVRT